MGRLRRNVKYENNLIKDEIFYIQDLTNLKGKWKKEVFKNKNPIHIEIGCGKGNFIKEQALKNPNINYIAIDKFLTILYSVLIKVKRENLTNVKIISICASQLDTIFAHGEIEKIYLNFSDPWPKKHHANRRLTNVNYLNIFYQLLSSNGTIEFKSDNLNLYLYSLEEIKKTKFEFVFHTDDLYKNPIFFESEIKTEYEKKWMAKNATIKKIILLKK